ncbi:1080_t:CDS:2 [Ambispora gerdemannii]|uniref:1080_t:CDS:1 n=1 Tax=Ambispora gerdemannii TaxID=144530 RepID=A0A9N9F8J1_9GLOM|nr:1080_t:CDS:2 [Ambispora gerdemannii]
MSLPTTKLKMSLSTKLKRKSMKIPKMTDPQVVKLPAAGSIAVDKLMSGEKKVEVEARAEQHMEQEEQLRELTTKPDVYQILPYADEDKSKCVVKYPSNDNKKEQHIAKSLDTLTGKGPTVRPEVNQEELEVFQKSFVRGNEQTLTTAASQSRGSNRGVLNNQFEFPLRDKNELSASSPSPRDKNELSAPSKTKDFSLSSFTIINSLFPLSTSKMPPSQDIIETSIDTADNNIHNNIDHNIANNNIEHNIAFNPTHFSESKFENGWYSDPEGMKKSVDSNLKSKVKRFQETKGKMPMDQSLTNSSNKNTAQYGFASNNFQTTIAAPVPFVEPTAQNSDAFFAKISSEVAARVESDMEHRLSKFFSDVKESLSHEINKLQNVLPSSYDEKRKEHEWINVEEARFEKIRDELTHVIKEHLTKREAKNLKNQHELQNTTNILDRHNKLQNQHEALQETFYQIQKQLIDYSELNSQFKDLQNEHKQSQNQLQSYLLRYQELQNKLHTVENELNQFRRENVELVSENAKLSEENQRNKLELLQQQELTNLGTEFSVELQRKDSSTAYLSLENDLNQARDEMLNLNREYEDKIMKLNDKCHTLTQENQTLLMEEELWLSKEAKWKETERAQQKEIHEKNYSWMVKEEAHRAKCQELENKIRELQLTLDKNKEIEKDRIRDNESSQKEIIQLRDQNSALEAKLARSSKRNREMEVQLSNFDPLIKHMEEEAVKLELELMCQRVEPNTEEVEKLRKLYSDQQSELENIEKESKENKKRIENLEMVCDQSRSELELVRKHNKELEEDLNTERNKNFDVARRIKQETDKLRITETEKNNLRQQLTKTDVDLKRLRDKVENLETKTAELSKVRSELNEVHSKLKDAETQKSRLQRENNKIPNLESEKSQLQNENKRLRGELDGEKTRIKTELDKLREADKEKAKMLEKINNLKNTEIEANRLRSELSELSNDKSLLQTDLRRVEAEKLQLKAEILRLTSLQQPQQQHPTTFFPSLSHINNYNSLPPPISQTTFTQQTPIVSQQPVSYNYLPNNNNISNNVQSEAIAMVIPTINSQTPFVNNFLPTTQGDAIPSINTADANPVIDERKDQLLSETNPAVKVNPQTPVNGRKSKSGSRNHSRKNSRQTNANNHNKNVNQKQKGRKLLNHENGSSSSATAATSTNNITANEPLNTAVRAKNTWKKGNLVNSAWWSEEKIIRN